MSTVTLITDFARHAGLGSGVSAEGVLTLLFDGKYSVTLEPTVIAGAEQPAILIYAVLGPMPPQGPARIKMAEALLALNLFGAGCGYAAFAFDPLEEEILLNRLLPVAEASTAQIEAAVEDFVTRLEAAGEAIKAAIDRQDSGLSQNMEDLATGDRMWLRG